MKKRLGAALLAGSMFVNGCKDGDQKNTMNTSIPDLHAILDMKIQKSEGAEFDAYTKVMDDYYLASHYMTNHNLSHFVVDFKEILPLYIKESRLDPSKVSKSDARGVSQMRDIAFDEVQGLIGTKTYNQIPKKYRDLVCSMIYYSHMKNTIIKKTAAADKTTIVHFTYAAYNLGIGNFLALYEKADKPTTWEGLVDEVTDILDISDSHQEIIDSSYNVASYTDRFGDKKFDRNNTYDIGDDHEVKGSKLEETVRYVELIDGIASTLATNKGQIYSIVTISANKPFDSVLLHIYGLQKNGLVKEGNVSKLVNYILVDNGITNHSPHLKTDSIEIDASLISPYLIDKDIQQFSYKKVNYTKDHYYRSIFHDVLYTDTYNDILNIKETAIYKSSLEDIDEDSEGIPFDVKQVVDEAIIYLNYSRRISYDLTKNDYVLLPSTAFIDRYDEHREELKPIVSKLIAIDIAKSDNDTTPSVVEETASTGSIYVNPIFDTYANRLLTAPSSTIKTYQFFNPKLKKSLKKNGLCVPKYIILHHTGNMFNETKKAYHNINAHFYIDRDGNLYQSIADKGSDGNKKIKLGQIVQLNHAGEGDGRYGALWHGDNDITYKSIGIEIENGEDNGDKNLTSQQYSTLTKLLGTLSATYKIPEKNIITHSMVAVTGRKHKGKTTLSRGRKEDPWGFDHTKVGMKTDPFAQLDPDVVSGKIDANINYIIRDRGGENINRRRSTIDKMTYGLRVSAQKATKKKQH